MYHISSEDVCDLLGFEQVFHIVRVWIKDLDISFDKQLIWFRTDRDIINMFETVPVVGLDGVTYHGVLLEDEFVTELPPHIAKMTI